MATRRTTNKVSPPPNLRLVIDALENWGYQQGTTFLKRGSQFCSIGVLCDVYVSRYPSIAKWAGNFLVITNPDTGISISYDTIVPPIIQKWGRCLYFGWELKTHSTPISMVEMNDTMKLTHRQIAALLRRQYNV